MKKKKMEDIEIIDDEKTIKKRRIRKPFLFLPIILIVLGVVSFLIINYNKRKEEENKRMIIDNIKSHYGEYVKVNKDAELLVKENNSYKKIGVVYQDVILNLEEEKIDLDTKYFKLKDKDYYVKYENVEKSEKEDINDRYKNYLVFNKNIVTKDEFSLYLNDQKLYTFNQSMEFPIIINDYENSFYIEYDHKLLKIKKEDMKEIKNADNTKDVNQKKITTLAYHQVADGDDKCKDLYICIRKESFDKEMKYLKDNNYFTLTMEELLMYLKGSLQIKKGIVLTFDDGYKVKSTIEILEKYDLIGTVFVITSHFDDLSVFKSNNLIMQTHTHNMHRNYVCSGGNQGGAILCASEKEIINDLETSIKKLGNENIALAFPFYDYNEKAINALKKVGIKMSFIGRGGTKGAATPKVTNTYKIPRMTVWDESKMPFSEWKSYL